jgi:SOS-response transcriptional repressor LexA
LKEVVLEKYSYSISEETIKSCVLNLNFEFIRKEQNIIFIRDNSFYFHDEFIGILNNSIFKVFLLDSIHYSINSFDSTFKKEHYKNGFILYNKYSRKDVCRLLNWGKDISSTVFGYRTHGRATPCFVTYHKSDSIGSTINYNDHFINQSTFAWESKSKIKVGSNEIKNVINSNRILLFVKKQDGEGTDFYFMGDVSIIPESIKQGYMPETNLPVVHFKFHLQQPVIESLYQYITTDKIKQVDKPIETVQTSKIIPKQQSLNFEEELRNPIPLFDFYAAAGTFSEIQSEKNFTLIEGPENSSGKDYFACKIIGDSMNRVIPNGSICVFKPDTGGSRNGKIVLVENRDEQDPDFNSAFSIKTYSSEKSVSDETWGHESIVLRPNSYDNSYQNIIITEENATGMRVIGVFVEILKDHKK